MDSSRYPNQPKKHWADWFFQPNSNPPAKNQGGVGEGIISAPTL